MVLISQNRISTVEYIRSNSDCEKSQRKPLVPLAENHLISQGDVVGRKCDGRMLVRWTQCIPLAPKKIDLLNASPTPSPWGPERVAEGRNCAGVRGQN
jgi:hypothetical protein